MRSRRRCTRSQVFFGAGMLLSVALVGPAPLEAQPLDANPTARTAFIGTSDTSFTLAGKPFFVTGVNNHYLTYGSQAEVVRVLDDAVALGANVVRTFLQPVIGSPDGAVPTIWNWKSQADSADLGVHGSYLLYWDNKTGKPAVNDGPNGMQKVDFLIAEARKRNLRLIIAFLDFWAYTGGSQQMRAWYGSSDKSTFFFMDPRTKRDYRTWISDVLERVNSKTGVRYKDDPTIMAWELMNEPNAEPDALRQAWIGEMSAYVKSQDPKHLVSSGHANVSDRLADLALPSIDFGTWHGYPLFYKLSVDQFDGLIHQFCGIAAARRKPVLLEEFGYARSNPDAADAYAKWLRTMAEDGDCAGWLVWRLVSRQDSGKFPLDEHEQFDIRNDGSAIWNVLKAAAARAAAARGAAPDAPRNERSEKTGRRT